jgi:hypothetical protein
VYTGSVHRECTQGVLVSQVADLSQLPVLTMERGGPGRHRVIP